MIKKKGILSILIFCLVVGLLLSVNRDKEKKVISNIKIEEKEVKIKKVRRELVPDNPEDYGMIVFKEQENLVIQKDWNELLEDKVKKLKNETSLDTWVKLKKAVKEEPQKAKEKVKDLNKRLEEAEIILKKEPMNQEVEKRIKRLRMLKAISQTLAN